MPKTTKERLKDILASKDKASIIAAKESIRSIYLHAKRQSNVKRPKK